MKLIFIILAQFLVFSSVNGLVLNLQSLPNDLVTMAHYESSSHNHPLRNTNEYWIGEISYDWLNETNNQNLLNGIWSSNHAHGPSDGWQLHSPGGNKVSITSYWERPYGNSFSFSLPDNDSLNYSLVIHNSWPTNITKWSDLGYVSSTTYETGSGTQIQTVNSPGSERYNLEPGGIYSVSQNASGSGMGDSDYSIIIEPVPEPSTYALVLGGLAIGIAFLRRITRP